MQYEDEYHYEEVWPCKCISGWHKMANSDRGLAFFRPYPSCEIHTKTKKEAPNNNDKSNHAPA